MDPLISFRHWRRFFFRKAVDRWRSDWLLRKRRSKTLTGFLLVAVKRGANRRTYNKDEDYALSLTYLFYNMVKCLKSTLVISHLPSAADLSVPNGRLRSDTGSHTNISPSKMILRKKGQWAWRKDLWRWNSLINTRIKCFINKRRQTARPDIFSIEVGVIFAFASPTWTNKADKRS